MNNPDHISESLETIFWVKILKSLMHIRDPGWKRFGSGMEKLGSGSATLQYSAMIKSHKEDPNSRNQGYFSTIDLVDVA